MHNIMRYHFLLLILLLILGSLSQAQVPAETDTSISNYSSFKRSFKFSGLLQFRYTYSLSDSVDVNGKNYSGDGGVTNSFSLKRVRLIANAGINDHFDANVMINLAEFSGSPQNKVLETAFIRYHFNKAFNLQMGQFRPFFGPEDLFPADIIKSLDYSNQYYLFSKSAWQSFQLGISAYGELLSKSLLPLHYYIGVYNGNNRNQSTDSDKHKNYYARLELNRDKKLRIGINAAHGSSLDVQGSAIGADVLFCLPLNHKLQLECLSEFKKGTDFANFLTGSASHSHNINQYKNRGFYFFPNIRYDCGRPRLRSIEFSSRYEWMDENYKLDRNLRQTVTPMISLEFTDDYFARFQFGYIMDVFAHNIPLTTQYNQSQAVMQMQVRF